MPVLLANLNNGTQVQQLLAASGSKTFTVSKVATANVGKGMVALTPTSGNGAAIMVKLEGARQASEISAMAGKTVAVSKPAAMLGAGAGNNVLMFSPVKAGAAKAATSATTLVKLEGTRQGMQAAALTGQKFTVIKPMVAGGNGMNTLFLQPAGGGNVVALKMANAAPMGTMVGKTVTVGSAPTMAGGNQGMWMSLKSASGVSAKATAVAAKGAVAAKASTVAAPALKMKTVAMVGTGAGMGMQGAGMNGVEIEGMRAAGMKAGAMNGTTMNAGAMNGSAMAQANMAGNGGMAAKTTAMTGKMAAVGKTVTLGNGATAVAGAKLNAGVTLGKGATVAATARLGDNVTIGKGVKVAKAVMIGENTVVAKGVTIGQGAKIGSASVIGKGSMIAPGAVVPKGAVIAKGSNIMASAKMATANNMATAGATKGACLAAGKTAAVGAGAKVATAKVAGAKVAGATGGVAAVQVVAQAAQTGTGVKMMTVAATGATAGASTGALAGAEAAGAAAAGVGSGVSTATSSKLSLGMGLGLGPWGPVLLGTLGAAAVYGYMKTRQAEH